MSTQNTLITLISSLIETPLGTMVAIADSNKLYSLDFINRKKYDAKIIELQTKANAIIIPGTNNIIAIITRELALYFAGTLDSFTTPIFISGSAFQNKAWNALLAIPYGTTTTYAKQARMIGNTKACRAVARANSNNILAIIIPCHRVISSKGTLTGYAGGIDRKEWLLNHEKKYQK